MPPRVLIVGCGALGRELVALTRDLPGVDVTCLPAELHNRPERIPAAVAARIRARGGDYDRVFVAYADCGTGGHLDALLGTEFDGVERIPGAHCYEFYAGAAAFASLQDEEPGTFYLTDFLARQFETIVVRGLGLDRHPELRDAYFGNYRRLVYLAQTDDEELTGRAAAAANRLGLSFERRCAGLGELAAVRIAVSAPSGRSPSSGSIEEGLARDESLRPLPASGIRDTPGAGAPAQALGPARAPQVAVAPIPGSRSMPGRPPGRAPAGVDDSAPVGADGRAPGGVDGRGPGGADGRAPRGGMTRRPLRRR